MIPATVLSTQKNADGSDLYDEFNQTGGSYEGKLYPDQIKFPLVADALADEEGYVPLHVFVPVMEDISAGTGDQDVLLKLDWSTLTKTTEDDPAFEPEEPVEQSPAVDYTDAATGVKVNADKGVFDEGVQIVVSEITSGASLTAVLITAFFPTLYFFTPLFAFLGGMIAFLLVYSLSWKGGLSPLRIILVGVAVNSMFTGLMSAFNSGTGLSLIHI